MTAVAPYEWELVCIFDYICEFLKAHPAVNHILTYGGQRHTIAAFPVSLSCRGLLCKCKVVRSSFKHCDIQARRESMHAENSSGSILDES